MIDTVVIESPPIGYAMEGFIENFCIKSQAIQLKTGELVYSFTNGSLDGSFDSRISIQVKRERWTIDHNLFVEKGIKTPKKVKCEPYIRVECSVHKGDAWS
ncbi:hypothetical protein [Desulfitobacterium sp. LBE]|uniref:hypothetical protein n=1 Tax=Desulfitobacterium sp. LBE TaxID=884086 RepID=UPI0011A3DC65|nr:hypothetical protein [Desulfitobacterium sp. LBE]